MASVGVVRRLPRVFIRQFKSLSSVNQNLKTDYEKNLDKQENGSFIQHSPFETTFRDSTNVFNRLYENYNSTSNLPSLECGLTGKEYTFDDTFHASLRWPALLSKICRKERPVVALLMPNCPEFIVTFYGCQAAGAVVTSINPTYTPMEIAQHINNSGADVLVVESMVEPLIDATLKLMKKDMPVLINGKSKNNRPNIQDVIWNKNSPLSDPVELQPHDIAWIPYSSGTSGKPKGALISQKALSRQIDMITDDFLVRDEDCDEYHTVQLGILPFFHIYGMVVQQKMLNIGRHTITMPGFNPELFVSILKRKKVRDLYIVPPILQFLVSNPAITKDDLRYLVSVTVGGANVPLKLAEAFKMKIDKDIPFQEGFGMTECGISHATPSISEKLGNCGKLLPGVEAKIIDQDGNILPASTRGELCLKSASMMEGYLNDPEATAEAVDQDGWFHTGDIASYDDEGYFAIVDRIKELIKVKGLQVSPSEIEEALISHPDIEDAGVIGQPDPKLGEAPTAFLVKSNPNLTEGEVHAFMQERFSKHKQLKGGITFVDSLPKAQTGKLQRKKLKELLCNS